MLDFQELKECFETRNVALLQEVLDKLPKEEAAYHMKRCVDSGLWVTDAKAAGMCVRVCVCVCVCEFKM